MELRWAAQVVQVEQPGHPASLSAGYNALHAAAHPTARPPHLAVVGVVQVSAARQPRGELRLEAAVTPDQVTNEEQGHEMGVACRPCHRCRARIVPLPNKCGGNQANAQQQMRQP